MSSPPRAPQQPRQNPSSPRSSPRTRGPRRRGAPESTEASSGTGSDDVSASRRRRDPRPRKAVDQSSATTKKNRTATPIILERRPNVVKNEAPVPTGLLVRPSIAPKPPTTTAKPVQARGSTPTAGAVDVSLASSLAASPTPSSPTHKLLDQHLRFQAEPIQRTLSDLPGCFIVGAIGRKGTGKSTILSHFSTSSATFSPGQATTGIDVHVTPERIVLLDTQPLLLPGGRAPRDETLQTMRLVTFILSVCHVVLVVSDTPGGDEELLSFIRRIEAMRHRIIPLSREEQQSEERRPDLIYIITKCDADAFSPEAYANVGRRFASWFQATRLGVAGGRLGLAKAFRKYQGVVSRLEGKGSESKGLNVATTPVAANDGLLKEPNVFLIPRAPPFNNAATTKLVPIGTPGKPPVIDRLIGFGIPARYEVMVRTLRNQVFETPRYIIPGATPGALARRWCGISEREWLKVSIKSWEAVRKIDIATDWIRAGKA